ncbi:MAG: molybdenum ABC transporter permease subunit [Deltaproteobacteria bacterium 13_1_20CM_2_69_21]|nr:MAG: molybdenum ABC transporter permease subunit [Deltaproteobacteria bacterium 13_1_40CM_4_68_19]OLD35172.1 MAG: molybdenum ABC transporter permease subunit [Myxococcales bacterium 13_1_40CM_2_68_15]OLE62125.1 MAG: molybdenum ABC transporter permease subunit [Deltaproteobacteria bacterium 13_1_20CM_2_69_21]
MTSRSWSAVQQGATIILVSFLLLPVAALALTLSWSDLVAGARHPLLLPALRLSLATSTCSLTLVVVLGSLVAWWVARHRGRLSRLVESVTQLPAVIPPAVAGVGLLLAFGRRGLLGSFLARHGLSLAFSTPAVVLAETFVSAPFFIQAAIAAFRRVDENLLTVARTLGASPFRSFLRVALPLSAPGLVGGAAMSWARSLGEFGATLLFAGNLTGRTQTLPLAVYTAMESDLRAAQALALIMVVVAFAMLLVLRRMAREAGDA